MFSTHITPGGHFLGIIYIHKIILHHQKQFQSSFDQLLT